MMCDCSGCMAGCLVRWIGFNEQVLLGSVDGMGTFLLATN